VIHLCKFPIIPPVGTGMSVKKHAP
jgi:hypothetical protein